MAAEAETQREAEVSAAVNAFLTQDLLSQADSFSSLRASEAKPDITLREAVDRAEERFAGKPPILAWLHFTLTDAYRGLSRYEEAEHHARRVAAICHEHYGPEHRESIAAQSMVAKVVTGSSRFEEALALHEAVLAAKRKVFGEEHATTLHSRHRIACIRGELENTREPKPNSAKFSRCRNGAWTRAPGLLQHALWPHQNALRARPPAQACRSARAGPS